MVLWGASTSGPAAVPGTYQVRLTVDGKVQAQPLVVKRHPLRSATDADLKEQFALAIQVRDKVSEANNAVIRIRDIKEQVAERLKKSQDADLKGVADRLTANLTSVEEAIYQTKNQSGQDPLNYPIRLNNKLAALQGTVESGDYRPTEQSYAVFKELSARLDTQLGRLEALLKTDLAAFNAALRAAGLDTIPDTK
jgi:transketolase